MKFTPQRRRFLLRVVLPAAIILCGGVIWLAIPPIEPVYKGRTLSEWLERYGPSYTLDDQDPTGEAIRHIGTNAIPFLLQRLRTRDHPFMDRLAEFANQKFSLKIQNTPCSYREAGSAFGVLGASASNAVPELIKIYNKNDSSYARTFAVQSIGSIGPVARDAAPFLLGVVKAGKCYLIDGNWVSTDPASTADDALRQIHADPGIVIPELAKLLRDPDAGKRAWGAQALEIWGDRARAALPGLTNALSDPDTNVVSAASYAIALIRGGK